MSVLTTSWRCSLAATALWTLLGANSGTAVADGDREERPRPPVAERERGDRPPAAREGEARRDGERREGEARRDGERREGEARRDGERRDGEGRRGPREGGPRQPNPEREKMMQRLQEIREQVQKAEGEGKHDDADRLKKEAQELMHKMRGAGPRPGEREGGPWQPNPEQQKMMQRLRELREEGERAMKEGKQEDVERIKKEAMAIMQNMREMGPPPGGRGDWRGPGMPAGEGRPGPEMRRDGPPPEFRIIQELRNEVHEMRQEIQQLREQLKQLREQKGEAKPAK